MKAAMGPLNALPWPLDTRRLARACLAAARFTRGGRRGWLKTDR